MDILYKFYYEQKTTYKYTQIWLINKSFTIAKLKAPIDHQI